MTSTSAQRGRPGRRRSRLARMLAITTAAIVLAAAGCGDGSHNNPEDPAQEGGGSGTSGEMVAAVDVSRVIQARQAISRACRNGNRARVPDAAVSTLVEVLRAGPDDIFRYGS